MSATTGVYPELVEGVPHTFACSRISYEGAMMNQALIGILGVLLGILVNEAIRRHRRIEDYSTRIFEKRLQVYEELYSRLDECYEAANDVLSGNHSADQRHQIVSSLVFPLLEFMDKNSLYLNDEIAVHCGGMWMGVDEIPSTQDGAERASQMEAFQKDFADAKEMIKEESGLKQIDKLFRSITKPRYSSRLIEYYRKLQAERKKELIAGDE
jgi:hypothetical protein